MATLFLMKICHFFGDCGKRYRYYFHSTKVQISSASINQIERAADGLKEIHGKEWANGHLFWFCSEGSFIISTNDILQSVGEIEKTEFWAIITTKWLNFWCQNDGGYIWVLNPFLDLRLVNPIDEKSPKCAYSASLNLLSLYCSRKLKDWLWHFRTFFRARMHKCQTFLLFFY